MEPIAEPIATRQRILSAALELFSENGYHHTSVQAIAERVGITKAAVHYHFPRKIDLLLFITEPMWRDFETMIAAAETLPEPRWPVIEGYLDMMFRHRAMFRMAYHDPSLITHDGSYARVMALGHKTMTLVAGPDPDLSTLVRASQALSMLGDPIVMLPQVPDGQLRAEILAGARRLLGDDQTSDQEPADEPASRVDRLSRSQPARRRPGRPPALSASERLRAQQMHAGGSAAEEIAAALGVSRATVYRYLPTEF